MSLCLDINGLNINSQYIFQSIVNNLAIFYYDEPSLKISQYKSILLSYKDLQPVKIALENNDWSLCIWLLSTPHMVTFIIEIKTQYRFIQTFQV